jgi:hypothetical protein
LRIKSAQQNRDESASPTAQLPRDPGSKALLA